MSARKGRRKEKKAGVKLLNGTSMAGVYRG